MELRRLEAVRAAPVRIVAGLMSGTSMDGIDVAICRVAAGVPRLLELLGATTVPWDEVVAARLVHHADRAQDSAAVLRLPPLAAARAAAQRRRASEAAAHRQEVEKRNAERAASGKKSTPLPVPSAASVAETASAVAR